MPPATTSQASAEPVVFAYYEVDLAGSVRRLRSPGGADLGGYRYTAYGGTLEDSVQNVVAAVGPVDLRKQPLRWKGMWRFDLGGGVELYDARARMWSPRLGTFLSVDEFDFHDARSTLWGWPGQNPITYSDPSGREGLQGALVGAEIGAFAGAAIYVATAPTLTWGGLGTAALEGGIVGGAFGSGNWSAGILAVGALGVASDKDLYKFGLVGGPGASCPTKSGLGDLTHEEVAQIQRVVDQAERPLEVVGSAAKGARRNPGTALPFGKGAGTKSDIDYTTAGANRGNFEGLESQLPEADPQTPILMGGGDVSRGPVIRFEPGEPPQIWRRKR